MKRRSIRVWVAVAALVALIATASVTQLVQSRRLAADAAFHRSYLPAYLVSEWIVESMTNVELILRESIADIERDMLAPGSLPEAERAAINAALTRRVAVHGHMLILAIFDHECVIRFGSVEEIIGDSGVELNRRYCAEAFEEPIDRLKLTDLFVSSTGEMNVSATYPLRASNGDLIGFALAGLDLTFFQRWLEQIDDESVAITIMDQQRILLARRPDNGTIGQPVDDEVLTAFLSSGDRQRSFRHRSPVDGIDRMWTLRRTRDLPFVVAAGYTVDDVFAEWRRKLVTHAMGLLLVIAMSIALARAYQRNRLFAVDMEALAMRDELTGLMNRRSFEQVVRAVRARDDRSDGGLIMIDIDHFKAINDTHGHETGDTVLQEVAETIRAAFRSTDLICRWGGEEFLAFVSEGDLQRSLDLAERVRERVGGTVFGRGLSVTVSVGVALVSPQDDAEAAIRRADGKLYEAKRAGRNCVRY